MQGAEDLTLTLISLALCLFWSDSRAVLDRLLAPWPPLSPGVRVWVGGVAACMGFIRPLSGAAALGILLKAFSLFPAICGLWGPGLLLIYLWKGKGEQGASALFTQPLPYAAPPSLGGCPGP